MAQTQTTESVMGAPPIKHIRRWQIYRQRGADGNFPPRDEEEQKVIDAEITDWWAAVQPTI